MSILFLITTLRYMNYEDRRSIILWGFSSLVWYFALSSRSYYRHQWPSNSVSPVYIFLCLRTYFHLVFADTSSESDRISFWNVAERRVASYVYLKIDLISEATSNSLFNAPISSDYSDEDDPNSNHQFRVALEAKA